MAYVPDYEHDIFVSYARADDRPYSDLQAGREPPTGWVGTLVRQLKNELGQKIGRGDACKIWFDNHSQRGNDTLTEEIAAQLERSATFVAIVSPGYLASTWCLDELRLFTHRFAAELARRVFIVEKAPLDPGELSLPELSGRRGYRFWQLDRNEQPRTFAMPVPHSAEIEYYRQVEDLARDLRSQLNAMRSSGRRTGDPAKRPMPRIMISYRRADSYAITGRIYDRLVGRYGRNSVFRDVDNIPLGVDFRDHVAAVLDQSNIVLVVVGRRWLGGSGAQSRLNNPADSVRIEVETALRKGIPVIPILVDRKDLPKVEQLPDSLRDFTYRNWQKVDAGSDFDYHVNRLISAMDELLAAKSH
jgi:hypothetical protein